MKTTTHNKKSSAHHAAKKGADFFEDIVDELSDSAEHVKDNFSEYSEQALEYVKQNPGPSLLTALGVGVLIGIILARK